MSRLLTSLSLVALLALAAPAIAADTPSGGGGGGGGGTTSASGGQDAAAGPSMADARARIAAKDWAGAVKLLSEIVDTDSSNADAYNLLGYSWRNLGKYAEAGRAYRRALTLDPRHVGALEYQGILFIKLGELDKARANLEKLKTLCGTSCEEYKDLAEALD